MTTKSARFPSGMNPTSQQSSPFISRGVSLSLDQQPLLSNKLAPTVSSATPSIITKTLTSASVHSNSTISTTYDSNWLPNSIVKSQDKIKVTLKLSNVEIEGLRKSWVKVITNTSSNLHPKQPRSTLSSPAKGGISTLQFPAKSNASFTSSLFCIQFYQNLISMNPAIEKLIPSIKHQASAFAGVINIAMSTLDDLSRMNESLENLGRLHSRILGIESEYFQIMGEALIKTFKDRFLGSIDESTKSLFSLETEESWIKLYCFLANSILQGGIDPVIQYYNPATPDSYYNSEFEDQASSASSVGTSEKDITPSTDASDFSYNEPNNYAASLNKQTSSASRLTQKAKNYLQGQKARVPNANAGYDSMPSGIKETHAAIKERFSTMQEAGVDSKRGKMKLRGGKKDPGTDNDCIIM